MSRIGKQPIEIPTGVSLQINDAHVCVTGPKGTLDADMHPFVRVSQEGTVASVSVQDPTDKDNRSLWGLWQRLLLNMVQGVSKGFEKKL